MEAEDYIEDVKNNLRVSYFEPRSAGELLGLQSQKKFLGIPVGTDREMEEFLSQFSAFYRFEESEGSEYDIRESVLIVEAYLREGNENGNVYEIIKNYTDIIVDAAQDAPRDYSEKTFMHVLFVTREGTSNMKKMIINGATASHPDYAVLPILADLSEGSLTYRTEPMGERGMFGRPFITQISERVPGYFSVA